MKNVIYLLAAAATFAAPAAAAQSFDASRTVRYLEGAPFEATLAEMEATSKPRDNEDNTHRVVFSNELIAMARFRVCNNGNSDCRGLVLTAVYTVPDGVSSSELQRRVNLFNASYSTAKAVIRGDGAVYFTRYVISDGGISMENYRVNMSVFENMREPFENIVLNGRDAS